MSEPWKVNGLAELNAALNLLSSDVATRIGQAADRAGAVELQRAIIAAAPVGPTAEGQMETRRGRKVAHAKISLNVRVRKTKNTSPTAVQTTVTTGKSLQASFEEFGSIHNPPTRFMTKAVQAAANDAIAKIAAVLQKRIAKANK